MKNVLFLWTILLLAICFCSASISVQAKDKSERKPYYIELGVGPNTSKGLNLTLSYNAVIKNRLEWSVGLIQVLSKAEEMPRDYAIGGIFNLELIYPFDQFTGGTLGAAYRMLPFENKNTIILLRTEFLLGNTNKKTNFVAYNGPGWRFENYDYTPVRLLDGGLKFSASLQAIAKKYVGVHLSAFGILKTHFSCIGLNIGLQIGRIDPKDARK